MGFGCFQNESWNQLIEFFYDKAHRRLESYTVGIIKWGDEKFDKEGLIKFIESTVEIHSEDENALLESLENGLQGNCVFKEDMENPLYLKIVEYFKGLKEANKEIKKAEKKK